MSQIVLCNQSLSSGYLKDTCGIETNLVHGLSCQKPGTLQAFTPYLLNKDKNRDQQQIINQLSPKPVAEELTNLSLSFGGDNTLAIAEITKQLKDYNIGLIGASTSVYADRVGGFAKAIKEYQDALMAYRSALSSPANKRVARDNAHKAFQKLQIRFRNELNAINSANKARRGTPLTSASRATNIARSSRNTTSLNVSSQVQASNLVKLTQHAKYLGNGLAVIDFGSRIGNVHNSYKAGGNWERELFIESSSFAASATTGSIAVSAGLTLLLAATPAGWVGLIVGGALVAGTAAGASMWVNGQVKDNAGSWYDNIMRAIK
ncbi:hypothetical protein [Endozoicomonas numazuensis]|uniref:Channel forming colicins domain-containing protein n=1 Tax=Endozoicomonas numazuensis TaxID=1137799 RepID=A0A081NHI0_9GAMM|nr:hypothetical protein [Endozoicomonas numazuensis]KEQ17903.1 hypothetical protein GZ78_09715 [Endozoicomonas numazuensis]